MDHRIILGDCLDPVTGLASLGDKSIGVAITDPPYGAHVHGNFKCDRPRNNLPVREAITFVPLSAEDRKTAALQLARVVRRWIVVFTCDYEIGAWQADMSAEYVRQGAWIKSDKTPQMSGDRPSAGLENLLLWHGLPRTGRMHWNGGGHSMIYVGAAQEWKGTDNLRSHPTQKPLWLMESLIRDFTDFGELVCDPFAGSGTTGVACKRLGRRFIGWERNPKYHAIAEKRIRDTQEQLGIFRGPRTPNPKTRKLDFGETGS